MEDFPLCLLVVKGETPNSSLMVSPYFQDTYSLTFYVDCFYKIFRYILYHIISPLSCVRVL